MMRYRPFLDAALLALHNQFSDLAHYPVPKPFERLVGENGSKSQPQPVITESVAYCTSKLRHIRAACIDGGPKLQVLNFTIFPELDYELPFFGADLVILPKGSLVAIDWQPLFGDDPDYVRRLILEPMGDRWQQYQTQLPWGGAIPAAAAPFFSDAMLWTRPEEFEDVANVVFDAFCWYLEGYVRQVSAAQPVTGDRAVAVREAQLRYVRYRSTQDPARGMLQRIYGAELAEAYIHGFLFNLEQELAERDKVTDSLSSSLSPASSPSPRISTSKTQNSKGCQVS